MALLVSDRTRARDVPRTPVLSPVRDGDHVSRDAIDGGSTDGGSFLDSRLSPPGEAPPGDGGDGDGGSDGDRAIHPDDRDAIFRDLFATHAPFSADADDGGDAAVGDSAPDAGDASGGGGGGVCNDSIAAAQPATRPDPLSTPTDDLAATVPAPTGSRPVPGFAESHAPFIPAHFDPFDTNANLCPRLTPEPYASLSAGRKHLVHLRFGGVPDSALRRIALMPHGTQSPHDLGAFGPSRVRANSAGAAANSAIFFNQQISHDFLCLSSSANGARAFASATDAAGHADDPLARFSATRDLTGTIVVRDAIVIADRATRFTVATLVGSHNEVAPALEQYFHRYGVPLTIASDGEPANHSAPVRALCATYGVGFTRSNAPYHPHHNDGVESAIYLLKRRTIAILSSAGLSPQHSWPDALMHAADILNITPRDSLGGASPWQRVHGRPPDLRHFRRYGCVGWVLSLGAYKTRGFLHSNTIECMYIGTGLRRSQLGAMFLLPDGKRIVTEHYRVDESCISAMLLRRPPAVAMLTIAPPIRPRTRDFGLIHDAKRREIRNLCEIHTFEWHEGPLPEDARSVPGIIVLKRSPDGALKLTKDGLAKARLCLRGDTTPLSNASGGSGVPTFAPCISWCAFLIFTAIAAAHGTRLLQADVVNAYVQADLHAHPNVPPTFMPLTAELRALLLDTLPGAPTSHIRFVRVRRALYGLRESARLFNDHFDAILRKVGFTLLGGEPCLCVHRCTAGFLLLCLHVDDFLHACCSASVDDYDRVHKAIQSALDDRLKTAGPEVFIGADYFALAGTSQDGEIGAALHRSSNGMWVSVSAHIIALCDRLLPHDLPPSKTDTRVPMSESVYRRLAHKEGAPIAHDHPDAAWLRSVMGVTIWVAARCRPDIAFATHFLSRGVGAPTATHIAAAIHLLRYLCDTCN
jgi:hypothetical protein